MSIENNSLRERRAIVIGGSLAGLLTGNLLKRSGWKVDIFERAPQALASRGAGLALHPGLTDLLDKAGADLADFSLTNVAGRTAYRRSGEEVAFFRYPQKMAAWSQVFGALKAAFPVQFYHLGKDLADFEEDAAGVTARFTDGEVARAELLIGADGFRSVVRALRAPSTVPTYCGYVAWRGMVDQNELSMEFLRDTFDRYAFCFPGDGQFVGFPVVPGDATHSRGRRYNFLWYRHVRAGGDLIDLLTDCQGATHEFSIPPQLIQHRHIEVLRRMASDKLPSIFAEAVGKARQFLLQPIYELVSTRMAFGRVALVGDAAFVTRPHAGTGALKAAEDAFALSECLRLSVPVDGALRKYEAKRLQANINTVRLGRYLGAFIERGLSGPEVDPQLELDAEKIVTISARPTEDVLRFLPPSF